MILVIFSHVSIRLGTNTSFVNDLFLSFRMPLFFFISGFIGYKANVVWNRQTWWTMSKKKIMIQLLPTLIFGLIYAFAYCKVDFYAFIMDPMKIGYWFTIVLLEMFIILYTLNFFVYKSDSIIFKKRQLVFLCLLAISFCLAKFVLERTSALSKIYNLLSLPCLFKFFPYFALGLICSMNKEWFNKILENRWFAFGTITLFGVGFLWNRFYLGSPTCVESSIMFSIFYYAIGYIIAFLGLLIVYNTFRIYQDSYTSDKKIGKALQYIGRRTLDIYLLHYFFLFNMSQMGAMLPKGNNIIFELTIGGGLSLIIVGASLVVSSILRTSPILAKYLFGVKC